MKFDFRDIITKGTVFFFLLFGVYILFPSERRALLIFPLAAMGLFSLLAYRRLKWNRLIIVNASLYIIYFLGFFLISEDQSTRKVLETSAALIVCPVMFAIFASNQKKLFSEKIQDLFFQVVMYSGLIYSIIAWIYMIYRGLLWDDKPFGFYITQLTKNIPVIYDHPIYTSLVLSIALLFAVFSLSRKSIAGKRRIGTLLSMIILAITLVFLSRRGVLLAFGLSLIVLIIGAYSKFKLRPYHYLVSALLVIAFISLNPSSRERMSEIFSAETYIKKNETNSTSNRIQIYKCAVGQIAKKPWLGYGINDDKLALYDCYKKTLYYLYENRFNTHNQYLGIAMKSGMIGLLIFLIFLGINLQLGMRNNDVLFISILTLFMVVMLFENILERQNGVMMFSLLINYFAFKNILNKERTFEEKIDMTSVQE